MFWAAEGAGADWPHGDLAILGLLAFVIVTSLGLVAAARVEPSKRTEVVA
jgi:uncharacterized membrane protein